MLWSAPSVQSVWSGSRALLLSTQKRSVGSSALSSLSGISYLPHRDICILSLSDGSFHVIHALSTSPSLDPPPSEGISSETLSAASRALFARAEPEKVTLKDVDRVNGMAAYDGGANFAWTYECVTLICIEMTARKTNSLERTVRQISVTSTTPSISARFSLHSCGTRTLTSGSSLIWRSPSGVRWVGYSHTAVHLPPGVANGVIKAAVKPRYLSSDQYFCACGIPSGSRAYIRIS